MIHETPSAGSELGQSHWTSLRPVALEQLVEPIQAHNPHVVIIVAKLPPRLEPEPEAGELNALITPTRATNGWREETFLLPDNQFDRIALRAVAGPVVLRMMKATR